LPDGSIVFALIEEGSYYWLACAPATKRGTDTAWQETLVDTPLPNVTSGNDPNSGFYNSSVLDGYGSSATANYIARSIGGSQYFLPNKQELSLLWQNKTIIDANDTSGGLKKLNYISLQPINTSWSSTEYDQTNAWQSTPTGSLSSVPKSSYKWIIPCTRIPA
jgi:hypothetical protein